MFEFRLVYVFVYLFTSEIEGLMESLSIKDFAICGNNWTVDDTGECWRGTRIPRFIIDSKTGKKFLNEDYRVIVLKCFGLIFFTPVAHSIGSACNVAYRIARLLVFYHFWSESNGETVERKLKVLHAGQDLGRVAAAPLAIIGLEFAAIYGVCLPYDGRKLYGSIEKAMYGKGFAAPCFQAYPKSHLLGGDINKRYSI